MTTIPESTKTILWDLDGTLLDSFGVFRDVLREVLPEHGLDAPAEGEMKKNFHGSLQESICESLGGGLDEEALGGIVRDFLAVQDVHYGVIEHHLCKDAVDLAKRAQESGIRQVIVTNREHAGRQLASPRSIVERSELKDYISEIICGDDGTHRKPFPEVLDVLKDRDGLEPEETIVIGDQFVDAELARNLGTKAIIVCRDDSAPQHMERLGEGWREYVTIVPLLDQVEIAR